MSTAPAPTHLLLLTDLTNSKPLDKVRFLGCVKTYDISTRTLELDRPSPSTTSGTVADVDVEHVLETIKREEMEVGAWINVMGYVMDDRGRANAANTRASRREKDISNHVRVQAISVWSAGDVDVEAYEKAVRERQQVQS